MHLEYILTFAEHQRAAMLLYDKIPSYQKNRLQLSAIIGGLFVLLMPFSIVKRLLFGIAVFLLIYFLLFHVLMKFLQKASFAAQEKQGKNLKQKEIDFMMNKKEFIYNSVTDGREESVSVPWSKVTLALKTEKMYIFHTEAFSTMYILKIDNKADEEVTQIEQTVEDALNEYNVPFKML